MRGNDAFDAAPSGAGIVGWACRQVLIWSGVGVAIYLGVAYRPLLMPPESRPPGAEAQPAAQHVNTALANSMIYRTNKQGHVVLDAAVNGANVQFLVDTGATVVALTLSDAEAAGIRRGQLEFKGHASTASGVVRVAPVTLREIRLDQFSAYDVPAVVIENLGTSLLGMSFLTRLQSYEMRDGALTMTW